MGKERASETAAFCLHKRRGGWGGAFGLGSEIAMAKCPAFVSGIRDHIEMTKNILQIEEDSEDNEVPVKSNSRRRKLPLFALQKVSPFVCSFTK